MKLPPALTQKVGPLPLVAWGGIGAAGLVVVRLAEGRKTATPPAIPIDYGAGGSPGVTTGGGDSSPGGGMTDPSATQSFDLAALASALAAGAGQDVSVTTPDGSVTTSPQPEPVQNPNDIASVLAAMRATLAGLVGSIGITLPGGAQFTENVTGAQAPDNPVIPPILPPNIPPVPLPPAPGGDPNHPPTGGGLGGFLFNLPAVYHNTSNFFNQWGSSTRPAMQGISPGTVLSDLGGLVLPVAYQPDRDSGKVAGLAYSGGSLVLSRTYDIAKQNGQLGNQAYVQAVLKTQLSRLKQDLIARGLPTTGVGWDLSNVPAYYATSYAPGKVDVRW